MPISLKILLSALFLSFLPQAALADDVRDCAELVEAEQYETAYPVCERAAERGNVDAQNSMGIMYDFGEGTKMDDEEAVKWYRRAAEQGHAAAQNSLGFMYSNGEGVAQNESEAIKWYRAAAEQGHAMAQNNLGLMYSNGKGVPKNDTEAIVWYRKAAEQGHAKAQYNLGVVYLNGMGVKPDTQEAYVWFFMAANEGYSDAWEAMHEAEQNLTPSQISTASEEANRRIANNQPSPHVDGEYACYLLGYADAAYPVCERAAEQGDISAQQSMGDMYYHGSGVSQDYNKAAEWYRKAAEQGLAEAQYNLGIMYDNGEGVPEDDAEAVQWYRKAAKQGYADAQNNLGTMYENGSGVPKNQAEAIKLYRMAAEQGDAIAQANLQRASYDEQALIADFSSLLILIVSGFFVNLSMVGLLYIGYFIAAGIRIIIAMLRKKKSQHKAPYFGKMFVFAGILSALNPTIALLRIHHLADFDDWRLLSQFFFAIIFFAVGLIYCRENAKQKEQAPDSTLRKKAQHDG